MSYYVVNSSYMLNIRPYLLDNESPVHHPLGFTHIYGIKQILIVGKSVGGVHTRTVTLPYSYPQIVGSTCISGPKVHTLVRTDRIAQYVQLSPHKLDTMLVISPVSKTNTFNSCV